MGEHPARVLAYCRERNIASLYYKRKLAQAGYDDFPAQYERLQQLHLTVEPPYTGRRTVV